MDFAMPTINEKISKMIAIHNPLRIEHPYKSKKAIDRKKENSTKSKVPSPPNTKFVLAPDSKNKTTEQKKSDRDAKIINFFDFNTILQQFCDDFGNLDNF
ncbi:hypothetical protein M0813_24345 [Anaeramoeba flamelloides]|uniref:Uncharacterized protein n=1 Tax=Anaeramoeba flamelloides TaxID=1746091 RepID=A0ABQ8Y864_9EUKA|nr:hypothetical protein M0813_24345 [Anaeramoeba flamelloides]